MELFSLQPVYESQNDLRIPPYESEELSPPRILPTRPQRFISIEAKSGGKATIAQNLCNMDDRLEYIEQLNDDMMRQIQDTNMVSFYGAKP